jgi:hypothetical protein
MGPLRNYLPNFSNRVYYKQQKHLWACAKELGDRKLNIAQDLRPSLMRLQSPILFCRRSTYWILGSTGLDLGEPKAKIYALHAQSHSRLRKQYNSIPNKQGNVLNIS